MRASKLWANNSFNDFSQRVAVCLSSNSEMPQLITLVQNSLDCAVEDNRISGLLFRNEQGKIVYSLGKTPIGEGLSQRQTPLDLDNINPILEIGEISDDYYKKVVTISPINLIQTKHIENKLLVDLIQVTESDSIFEKREIEVPKGVDAKSITGTIIIMDGDKFSYAIDVLVYTPTTYKYSKDIFSVGSVWLISIILIALQFSLVLSYHFSRQLENYAKGLRKALFKLSRGEEDVKLPQYNVEEYDEINEAVRLLDSDLAQNRKNRKAWLRNITHDFNTPVTSMQILIDGVEDKVFPLNYEIIAAIKKEHTDLSNRIKRVVLYASLLSPDKQVMISKCNTDEIINALNKSDLDMSRVKFVEFERSVEADFSAIVLALTCLIENAIEYGKDEVSVEFSTNEIRVINKGLLLKDVAIFQPWERGDKSRSTGGNGLGLPIAYEVMRLHKGKIQLFQDHNKVVAILNWVKQIK